MEVMGARSGFQGFLKKVIPLQRPETCPALASQASHWAFLRARLEKDLANKSTELGWRGLPPPIRKEAAE